MGAAFTATMFLTLLDKKSRTEEGNGSACWEVEGGSDDLVLKSCSPD